ncbi:MAG: transglutaminase-like domain-containing protein, partial [Ignavibacteriaceae bacterium]
AATKLSKWVAENISYAIPGGGTAKKTYEIRAGECGSHSFLLAAFCRAVGIPARVVWGAMYVPNFGGGFGQHGWNEIYMGENGWIPVDATAFETDFVDAGHIRIAEYESVASSFNGNNFEVLDYKLATTNVDETKEGTVKFGAFIGKYKHDKSGKTFAVLEKDGNLSVDIPGQMVLPFNEADEEGRRYCKLSPRLYIKFNNDESGKISEMMFHEIVSMTRKSDPKEINEDIPEKYKPYLGNYLFAAVNAEFTVSYDDNTLSIYDPLEKENVKLQPPDENGRWLDEYNKNTIYFEFDKNGKVTALNIDATNKFEREK